jgi:hypothetical protein
MRSLILKLFTLLLLNSFSFEVCAQVQSYDRVAVRSKLLELITSPPRLYLVTQGDYAPGSKAFQDFFISHIFPKLQDYSALRVKYTGLQLLRDSGSQDDEAEFDQWSSDLEVVADQLNGALVDTAWSKELKKWAELARDLSGLLPDMARRMAKERQLEEFAPRYKADLNEVSKLEKEYEDAIRAAPANAKLKDVSRQISEAQRRFDTKEIDFFEAQRLIRSALLTGGRHFVGGQAAIVKGENLNRIALLRSLLAKSKGFKTWAEFALERSGQAYDPAYRNPARQREFLNGMITALKPMIGRFLELRMRILGLDSEKADLRSEELNLLLPTSLGVLNKHFPADQISRTWETVMRESGFSDELLGQIILDDELRDGKNRTMAYTEVLQTPSNLNVILDLSNIEIAPTSRQPSSLQPGLIYMLQSYLDDGIYELTKTFHEGGHAMDFLLQSKNDPLEEAYGWAEIASMTSERFASDVDVLWNHASPINGVRPDREKISDLRQASELNSLVSLATGAAQSLVDIELWDYDYSATGADTFLERLPKVYQETRAINFPSVPSDIPFHFGYVATTHFISGRVQNAGYDFAEIGSRFMADHISNELERRTGRRSWYNQRQFAEIFMDIVWRGWKKPFPASIEEITGKQFDPKIIFDELDQHLETEIQCARLLEENHK